MVDRDEPLERMLLDIAVRAAGLPSDHGLHDYAARRALAGPVVLPRDWDREIREEIADAVNYLRWAIQETYSRVLAGDPAVLDDYERRMRVLSMLARAWRELHHGIG